MKTVGIIRNRGQLTIPDNIRKRVRWANPMSAVSISVDNPDEIVIRPHKAQLNWDEIWSGVNEARSIQTKGMTGSLSEFIAEDRRNH